MNERMNAYGAKEEEIKQQNTPHTHETKQASRQKISCFHYKILFIVEIIMLWRLQWRSDCSEFVKKKPNSQFTLNASEEESQPKQ